MIQLFTDGASSGSPGTSGIGLFLKGEGHILHISEPIADTNNHEAEFIALIRGLEEARALGTDFVLAHTDSKTVADAVQAKRTSNRTFQPYVQRLLTLIGTFDQCYVRWIPRKENRAADTLARRAIRTNETFRRSQ